MDLTDRALNALREGYVCLAGRPMDEQSLKDLCERVRPAVNKLSIRRLLGALGAYSTPPHRIVRRGGTKGDGAYAWIVRHGADDLKPFIWDKHTAGLPVRRYGSWTDASRWPLYLYAGGRARRGHRRNAVLRGKMRLSHTSQKKPFR